MDAMMCMCKLNGVYGHGSFTKINPLVETH